MQEKKKSCTKKEKSQKDRINERQKIVFDDDDTYNHFAFPLLNTFEACNTGIYCDGAQ